MKFDQLIEYNLTNIFLEKSYTKCGGETISRPFSKKSKLSISLDQYSSSLKKQKEMLLVSLPHFLHDYWRKYFLLYSFTRPNYNVWLPLLHEMLGNMYMIILCLPSCDIINFEINLIFSNQAVFSIWPKSEDKNLNILRTKTAFKMK